MMFKKRHYQKLCTHYSQGIQTQNVHQWDSQVAHKAFCDSLYPKDIGLMLSAGSEYVRKIRDQAGQHQALAYVNQLVRNTCQQHIVSKASNRQSQLEL